MALIWTGDEVGTLSGANRLGHDMQKNRVVVSGSHEAIEDYGWRTIWQAAETKYARGEYEQKEDTRSVRVTTADCEAEDNA